jgi:hypothetical protein
MSSPSGANPNPPSQLSLVQETGVPGGKPTTLSTDSCQVWQECDESADRSKDWTHDLRDERSSIILLSYNSFRQMNNLTMLFQWKKIMQDFF